MPSATRFSTNLRRKCNLREEDFADLLMHLENGVPVRYASSLVGVPLSKLMRWLARGEQGIQPYDQLYEAVEVAKARAVAEQVANLRQAACEPRYWKASVYLLEHIAPEFNEYGNVDDEFDVSITVGGELL